MFLWIHMDSYGLSFKMFMSWLFPSFSNINKGKFIGIPAAVNPRWTSRTWVRRMQWIPGRQRVRCFCKEITLVKVDCINLCIWYIYIRVWVCATYTYIIYLYLFILCLIVLFIFIFIFACVCVCVCVRSVACGRPNPQDRDVLTSELMDLDPHKLLTLVKRIWRYWKLTANRRSSVITRYNKPSGKSSRFITLGYVGVFFHTFSHVFTFILAMACWLDRRSCQRTSRA